MTAADDNGLDASAFAGFSFSLGKLSDSVDQLGKLMYARYRRENELQDAVRFIKAPAQIGTISAAGALTLDLDGPKTGYQWTVRRVSVSDAVSAPATMSSALGWLYAGVIGSTIVPQNLEWIFPTLPNSAVFSSDEIVLQYGEHLYLVISGGTNGQVVQASVTYQLYPTPGTQTVVT